MNRTRVDFVSYRRWRYKPWRFWEYKDNLLWYARQIKWFFQRGWRGWADCDTWDLNDYLLSVMAESINHLRNHLHGYPGEGTGVGETEKEWNHQLSFIVAGLTSGSEYLDDLGDLTPAEMEDRKKQFDEAWQLLGKAWFHMWD